MRSNGREYPNTSCAQRSRALQRYFAAWASILLAPGSAYVLFLGRSGLLRGDGNKRPGWCLGVSLSPPFASPRHTEQDVLDGHRHWI